MGSVQKLRTNSVCRQAGVAPASPDSVSSVFASSRQPRASAASTVLASPGAVAFQSAKVAGSCVESSFTTGMARTDSNGQRQSGHWMPKKHRAGLVWVPGHVGEDGRWVLGFWRLPAVVGYVWVDGYWCEGSWYHSHWAPLTPRQPRGRGGGYGPPSQRWGVLPKQ